MKPSPDVRARRFGASDIAGVSSCAAPNYSQSKSSIIDAGGNAVGKNWLFFVAIR